MNTYSNLKLLELLEVKDCIKDNKCRKAHKHSQLNTAATDPPQSSVTSQLAASSLQSGKLFCTLYYQNFCIYVYMHMDLCDSFTPTFYSFLQDWTTGAVFWSSITAILNILQNFKNYNSTVLWAVWRFPPLVNT